MSRTEFNELVYKISRKLYGHAYHFLRDQSGAEDAVQEVFIKLWKMNAQLYKYDSIEALASTMTKNYCIDQLRKVKELTYDNDNSFSILKATGPTPGEQMEQSESMSIIARIIEKLPDGFREIVRLRDIEGLSYEEIAEMTEQNINTLRVNLSRARKTIRDEYKKYYYEYRGNKKAAGEIL